MILVCYDGSADAQAAIDDAAQLMPGADATVLAVCEPFVDAMAYSGSVCSGVGSASPTLAEKRAPAGHTDATDEVAVAQTIGR